VRLHEHAGHADRDRRTRQHRHELALPARARAWPPGSWTEWVASKTTGAGLAHDGEAAHVGDELL